MSRKLTPSDVAMRFAASYTTSESGCWLWHRRLSRLGYGVVYIGDGKLVYAHRYAWTSLRGPIPGGLHVLHRCDVRNCVNPEHLFLGTHQDNMADRNTKGRQNTARGSANGKAELTELDVRQIRSIKAPMTQIAKAYGVSFTCVWDLRNGRSWGHVR